jgi:hypothetical protein
MSWNNIIPWSYFHKQDHLKLALISCAFANEVDIGDLRDDWCNFY